jgi:hypothetical protein
MHRAINWCPVLSQIDTTQRAAFLVEGFDRYEEALQPFDVFLAFGCDVPLLAGHSDTLGA